MNNTVKLWVSRIFRGIISFALVVTAAMKIAHLPKMVEGLTQAGIPRNAITPIALLELTCLALYLLPRTMVLGAVLLTGYFGGAIVIHIIGHESVFPVIMIGMIVWGGVYFRESALQSLLPLRRHVVPASNAADPADQSAIRSPKDRAASRA